MKKVFYVLAIFICSGLKISAQTANWSAVLPNQFPTNVSGQIHGISRVSQMKFHHSNSLKRYAVSARGGLFITTNGGNNWTIAPGCDFMPYARFASVCIDHTNDQIIYLGTGDNNYYYNGLGVWKSTNGGTNFTQTGLTNKLVVDMIMDPLDNQKIVAITNTGIYKTNNAGTSWSLKTASRPFKEILIKATGSRTLYAASADSAFFRSTDFGETWSQINNGIVMPSGITNGDGCRIAVSPADTNVVYFAMVSNGGMLYKSVDGGSTFTARKTSASPYLTYYSNSSSSSGQGDYNFGIGVDRLNANIVYMVAHNNWKSLDGGLTWTQLTNWWEKCHTDMHQIVTSPYNNNELYNMNDGGVFLSTDGGNNWTPKSNGIYGYEIYHGNCSPTRRDMISIGTQDNGELYSTTAGWFTNRGGDWGSQCAFDYRPNSSMVYYLGNNQRRLVTGGDQTYGLPSRVVNLDAIEFHRSNSNLAFVADSFIYRSTNLLNTTPTWIQIAALGKIIRAMHVAFSDPNRLYIITNDGKIHVSANALSASPTFTVYNLPSSSINRASITTIKNSPGTVYITANTNVYRSTNFGATWTNITHNLPSFNHIKIIADEYYPTNELVLLATGSAVYYKVANANSWTLYNQNLPSRPEGIDLSIYNDSTTNTILRVATYGRGMWESAISNLRTLNAQLSASTQNPCVGQSMQFFDISTGNVISRTWSFPGGTPSSSTLQNPTVTYSTPGVYNVGLTISNGTNNSSVTQTNYITTFGASVPFVEGFEGTGILPDGWQNLDLSSSGIAWAKSTLAGGYGNSATSMMFDNYSWNYPGEKDELITPKLNLQGLSGAKLYFDLAYQVFSGYSDSLAVFVSTDCGLNYTKVYQKGGTVLSTAGSAGNNFVPTASQWRTDTISLNAYTGQQIVIKIQNINGYGNKLYLDNINIQGIPMAAFSGLPTTICAGQTVSFTNNSTGNPTTYLWSFPGGIPSTSTAQNPVVSYPLAGNYAVTLTASNANGANTSTLTNYIQVNANTNNTTTASACGSYTWSVNNQTYTQSGTYSSVSGCNTSILNLTITPNTSNTTTASACGSYTWSVNNQTYTQSGTYSSVSGCHTEILNLTITPSTSNITTASACSSYTWSVNNQTYTQSGTYSSVSGCNTSILNLTITPNTSNTTTASACSSYTWSVNNQTYTQSGTYSSVSGCNTSILNLTITPNTSNTTTASACSSYTWSVNNQTYTQSGTYSSVSGCHTEILNLTITPNTSNTSSASACSSYTWSVNNQTYTQSGTYSSVSGCHTEILNLTITPNTSNTSSASACSSYTWSVNNQTYTQSGTYSSVTGCNTEILNLTITPNTSNTTTASACSSYTWSVNTQTYTQSGTYSSVSGCHTEILNLTITPNTSNTITASACSSYTWSVNTQTYTQSGTYSSVSGCHTEILNLTITPNTSNTTTASACSSYTWSVNNQTYTQSGTYSSVSGCHTEILILTLNITSSNTSTISSCGPYTWPVNNTVYTQSGTYVNNAGCQQEILQLNILPLPVVQAQDVYACQGSAVNLSGTPLGGLFSLNNPYTGPSTSYSYTFTDNNGCTATSLPANIIVQNALPVTGLFVSNVGANSVTINWVSVQGLQWYEVRYRPIGAGSWTGGGTQGAPTTFKNLVGLDAATDYEIEVRGFCSAGTPGPWSSTFVFSTGPSCPSPQNLSAINVLGNQATLTWSAVSNVLYYQVRYRIQGGNSWSSGTSNTNSKVIVSLQANTTYEWQLRAVCLPSPFSNSSWSMIGDFSTNALKEALSFEQEESFSIFPNPASQILHVQFNSSVNEDTHIAVYDLSGRKMKQIILGPHEGSQQIDIDISDLVQGTYLIQWKTANSKSQQLYFNKVQ